ncbi:esterase FE4-like isoform X1 [Cotesia typhae]|uniref:esterase FE4-like isoform X1 n=1 Tax=Cotesia typhae TaxID=2053667 RepID=UPI003D690375
MMESPIVQIHQGKLRGAIEKNMNGKDFYAFRGIPYAKSPVGALRFKDPEPQEPWSGVREATKFGNICAQFDWITKKISGSDDCLFLNVYSTNLTPDTPRATLVWIHGGGFVFGSGDDDLFGPDLLIEKDIVLVTINYRLGVLGFLNLEDEACPGNQGLKDQVMALKWVQQNIAKFGGDPNNVTIFGESAGASSVHFLTISPLAQGLFHKAILQSGVATCPWASSSADSMKEKAIVLSSVLGNEITDTKKLIEYLQSFDALELVKAERSFASWKNRFFIWNPFLPSIDSKSKNPFLDIPLAEAVKSGIKVPHIIGYTSHEGIIDLVELEKDKYSEIDADPENSLLHPSAKNFLKEFNISVRDLKKIFMDDKKISAENGQSLANLRSASDFLAPIHHVLEIQPRIPGIPTYLYKFDHYSKETAVVQNLFSSDLEGTSHAEDLMYLFNAKLLAALGIKLPSSYPTESLIQKRFIDLWTNVAETGNPVTETSDLISVKWQPVDDSKEYNCLKIGKELSMIKETNILRQIVKTIQQNESTCL